MHNQGKGSCTAPHGCQGRDWARSSESCACVLKKAESPECAGAPPHSFRPHLSLLAPPTRLPSPHRPFSCQRAGPLLPQRRRTGAASAGRGGAGQGGRGKVGGAGPHLRSTPPNSDALRHSGGERRRCTSATVTLYFEVELRSDRRPGTEQKTSLGFTTPPKRLSLLMGMAETALLLDLDRDTGPAETDARVEGTGRPRAAQLRNPAAASCHQPGCKLSRGGWCCRYPRGSRRAPERWRWCLFGETAGGFYGQTPGQGWCGPGFVDERLSAGGKKLPLKPADSFDGCSSQ